jgi:hypothetical protein
MLLIDCGLKLFGAEVTQIINSVFIRNDKEVAVETELLSACREAILVPIAVLHHGFDLLDFVLRQRDFARLTFLSFIRDRNELMLARFTCAKSFLASILEVVAMAAHDDLMRLPCFRAAVDH